MASFSSTCPSSGYSGRCIELRQNPTITCSAVSLKGSCWPVSCRWSCLYCHEHNLPPMTQPPDIPRIVLASGSPRRKQLLEWAEIEFDIITRDTPETWPPGMPTPEVPIHIARNKALAVQQAIGEERLIIAADTVVVLADDIIGKPSDR